MREIKFRGRRTDNGEWVYGVPVIGLTSGVFMVWTESEAKRGRGELSIRDVVKQAEVIPETVGQYTGLNDRDGTDIYEGDVVKDNEEKTSYVAFLQQEMGYVLVYPKYDTRLGHRTRGSSYRMDCGLEVIGNIYDNPELIGVKNE